MVKQKSPPKSLQLWFILHFMIDIFIAIPLFLFPETFLSCMGFEGARAGIALSRVVAAALIAVGTISFLMHHKKIEFYLLMLDFKLIWSASAIVGLLISAFQTKVTALYLFAALFAAFFLLWLYWKQRLNR